MGGWRGRSGTRPTLSTPRALDQRDPRLLSLQRSLEPKFVGRWGPNIARAFLLLRGTWESLDSATALRPTAENGKRDTFPVPASRDLVPVGDGKAISSVSRSVTLRTTARQASLSVTNSQSLLKLISIESVMPSNQIDQIQENIYSTNKRANINQTTDIV